jgi:hypothetical protein
MNELPELHVIFTMGCDPIPRKAAAGDAPRNWEVSSRAIEGYTYRLARAGFPVTLFLDPWCVEEHTPLLEELMVQKAEYGAYVHPPNLLLSRFTRHLGEYNAADQRTMIEHVTDRFYEALGIRPRSFRGGRFSASDATFKVLYELGYRQGSLSRPGFDARIYSAFWDGAELHPHYAHPDDRLKAGDLPFFELPITTDPERTREERMPFDLTIDSGSFEALHRPIIDMRLAQMAEAGMPFRAICISTANRYAYDKDDDKHARTLDQVLDYFEQLAGQYTIVPVTLAGAHERYRRVVEPSSSV